MWLVVAAGTIRNSISGKMFYAPCLGTDLFMKKFAKHHKETSKVKEKSDV